MDGKSVRLHPSRMTKRSYLSPVLAEPQIKRTETPWVSIALVVTYCAALAWQLLP
jgi:hypothetical protein